jgi:DNA-binding NarL/FixJ family response regulator
MINVAIIEDDRDIREGIQKYINHQQEMICEVADESVERFLARPLEDDYPEVFLMDIGLPGMSGLNGTALIKESHPDVDIIMLTVYTDWDRVFGALRAGASGYLLKNTPLAEIKRSIELVHSGGAAMSPQIARKVMEFFGEHAGGKREPEAAASETHLTGREKEIVIGLTDGLSYKLIADRMGVSLDTIRFHVKNVYRKLHVNSKGEVIRMSLRGDV